MRLLQHDLVGTLRSVVDGQVITAGEVGYDRSRTPFFAHRSGRPAAVVRPRHAGDVAATVTVAAGSGTELSVRSGGHTAHSTGDGILLDLGSLTGLALDADHRTVSAGSGWTAGDLSHALGRDGLAIGFGDTGTTGIGGLTLGGGIGFLSRLHGLTIDRLVAAEVVTADGRVRTADAVSDPDLFWAIRGGGGNFGIVTSFQYRPARLHQVFGGTLMLPATPRTIATLTTVCREADRGLSVVANILPASPPGLASPGEQDGPVILARVCSAGPDGARDVQQLRDIAAPLVDLLQPMPYPDLLDEEAPDRGMSPAIRTAYLRDVGESAAAGILDHLARGRSRMRLIQLRVLGGAVATVGPGHTAYAHRSAPILLTVVHGEHPDHAWARHWAGEVIRDLDQGLGGAYVNFLGPDEAHQVGQAYPPVTLSRLRRIKAAYDPDNLFRHNVNITPADAPLRGETGERNVQEDTRS